MAQLTDIFEFTVSDQVWMITEEGLNSSETDSAGQEFLRDQEFFENETDEEKAEWMANALAESAEMSNEGDAAYELYERFKRVCELAGVEYS